MFEQKFDFYDKTTLKSYNLDVTMRYQLTMLDSLDPFTRIHSENVASICVAIKVLLLIVLFVHIYMILVKCLFLQKY